MQIPGKSNKLRIGKRSGENELGENTQYREALNNEHFKLKKAILQSLNMHESVIEISYFFISLNEWHKAHECKDHDYINNNGLRIYFGVI